MIFFFAKSTAPVFFSEPAWLAYVQANSNQFIEMNYKCDSWNFFCNHLIQILEYYYFMPVKSKINKWHPI